MDAIPGRAGRIMTFYSFKGGVGRTMAVANLAYLAALNGKRVLLMDWDLEAPGLAYYFRSLQDPLLARRLKTQPGILDIVWEWKRQIEGNLQPQVEAGGSQGADSFEDWMRHVTAGDVFERCVTPLVDADFLSGGRHQACLDFIGAGSQTLHIPDRVSYETALARFSWSEFFDRWAGGVLLQQWKAWARSRYDLILVDSRTGFADVAGLCTMQWPDELALCFVLNQQNIEGVAKVAASVRASRGDAIRVRAAPMRVSSKNTSEESDAKARAFHKLRHVGGFSSEQAERDFAVLSVPASDNVPFYETLAPLTTADPDTHVLTLAYRRMAAELLGMEITVPAMPEVLQELVRRRLSPRYATAEYVRKLAGGEPARMAEELVRLLDSAHEMIQEDEAQLDTAYIQALLDVAFAPQGEFDLLEEAALVRERSLELARMAYAHKPQTWRQSLLIVLERYLALCQVGIQGWEEDEELALLEEIDQLLDGFPGTAFLVRRMHHRRQAARALLNRQDISAAMVAVNDLQAWLSELDEKPSDALPFELDRLIVALDVGLLMGDISYQTLPNDCRAQAAATEYLNALARQEGRKAGEYRPELDRIVAELHTRLALLDTAAYPPSFLPSMLYRQRSGAQACIPS